VPAIGLKTFALVHHLNQDVYNGVDNFQRKWPLRVASEGPFEPKTWWTV